jgi:hypothetical protein
MPLLIVLMSGGMPRIILDGGTVFTLASVFISQGWRCKQF